MLRRVGSPKAFVIAVTCAPNAPWAFDTWTGACEFVAWAPAVWAPPARALSGMDAPELGAVVATPVFYLST